LVSHQLRQRRFSQWTVWAYQIKSNLFAISAIHKITIHEFAWRLAGQTGDSFALMSGL